MMMLTSSLMFALIVLVNKKINGLILSFLLILLLMEICAKDSKSYSYN
jgi:hypothetical protein